MVRVGTGLRAAFGADGFAESGEAVALSAAVGLVRDRHFDEPRRDRCLLVVLAEVLLVPQPERRHDLSPVHLSFKHSKHLADFGGDFGGAMRGNLRG